MAVGGRSLSCRSLGSLTLNGARAERASTARNSYAKRKIGDLHPPKLGINTNTTVDSYLKSTQQSYLSSTYSLAESSVSCSAKSMQLQT